MSDVTDNTTPMRPVRIEDDLWVEFGRLVGVRNRSQVIRDFIRWFVREHDAELPARPGDVERPNANPKLREILKKARNEFASSPTPVFSSVETEALSSEELQILYLVADGMPDSELAAYLKATQRTAVMRIKKVAAKVQAAGQVKVYLPEIKRST